MPETHIIAVLTPGQGQSKRLKELLHEQCKNVHKHEDYTIRYVVSERIDGDNKEDPEIVVIETYKDEESAKKHGQEAHTQDFFKKAEEEKLLGKAPWLVYTHSRSGFEMDRKLI